MKEKIFKFERKYQTQDDLLDSGYLEYLDERVLHETIKAMLINTSKDCIKYENELDPLIAEISQFMTKDEIKKMKHTQDRLKIALHLSEVAEGSLATLIYQMLMTDGIKYVFRQDIPELFESVYCFLDIEEEIADDLVSKISESYEELSYKQLCEIINNCIVDWIENAESYMDDIQEREFYDMFLSAREEWKNKKKENANE